MRSGTIQIDGQRLETAWWGPHPAEAPTIVLLHEGLGSVALWRDVPQRLAASTGWGVFAYSRFGYGQSDPTALPRPMTYMHIEAQSVLPRVLSAAGIKRAVLVGHSDGGSIAAIYAGTVGAAEDAVPEAAGLSNASFSGVLAADGSGGVPSVSPPQGVDGGPASCETARPTLLGLVTIAAHFFVEDLNLDSIRQIRTAYETSDLRARLARYHRHVDVAFHGWNGAWLDPRFRAFDITSFLPRIAVPILALQGADDPYGTDSQLEVLAANATAPVATHLIPDARHSLHLEAKDLTLATITDFIADLQRGLPA